MKKLLAVIISSLTLGSTAVFAKGNLPMAGCGLGYVLLGQQQPNDKVMQILAATTNGTFGNQTFGITSGTLGCTQSGLIAKNATAEVYADVNLHQLTHDIAVGKGEVINTFGKLIGVKDASRAAFCQLLKSNFVALFPSANTSSVEFLSHLDSLMSSHSEMLS